MSTRFLRLIITMALVALPFVVHAQGRRHPRPRPSHHVHGPVSSPQPDLPGRAISNYLAPQYDLPRRSPIPTPSFDSHNN
jgi:hypothetical protein